MAKFTERLKNLFARGKETKAVLIDTTALVVIGFIVIYLICDGADKSQPLGSNFFTRFFPPAFLIWLVVCIALGVYTKTKPDDEGGKN